MEGNKILDTASGLHTVNELLKKYVREQALSHEEKRDLWLFYKEFKDTNTLIDFAETVAHEKEHAGTESPCEHTLEYGMCMANTCHQPSISLPIESDNCSK